jgi:hypothetical protein
VHLVIYVAKSVLYRIRAVLLNSHHTTCNRHHAVRAARTLSPKPHFSYLDLCCLDARTLMLSLISFRYYLLYLCLTTSKIIRIHRRVSPQTSNLKTFTSWSRNSLCHTIITHALSSAYNAIKLSTVKYGFVLIFKEKYTDCSCWSGSYDSWKLSSGISVDNSALRKGCRVYRPCLSGQRRHGEIR